jgi:hypothetical protein
VTWRDFDPGDPFPSTWPDGIESLMMDFVGGNFKLVKTSATTVSVLAGTGDAQTGITIDGRPRIATANKVATHPGGGAGQYPIFVTAYDDDFQVDGSGHESNAAPSVEFALRIGNPTLTDVGQAERLARQVGYLQWDGTQITSVTQVIGTAAATTGTIQWTHCRDYAIPGKLKANPGVTEPEYLPGFRVHALPGQTVELYDCIADIEAGTGIQLSFSRKPYGGSASAISGWQNLPVGTTGGDEAVTPVVLTSRDKIYPKITAVTGDNYVLSLTVVLRYTVVVG